VGHCRLVFSITILLLLCAVSVQAQPVDLNANQTTRNELAYLISLEGNHAIQSSQAVVRTCMPVDDPIGNTGDPACLADDVNAAASGDKYTMGLGPDPCEAYWGFFEGTVNTPLCDWDNGLNSSIPNKEALKWWNKGGLLFTQVDFNNPYDNWNNVAPVNNTVVPLGTAHMCYSFTSGTGVTGIPGGSVDCSGISDSFIQQMLTCPQSYCPFQGTQTVQNQHFNSMLDGYAKGWQALQAAGAVIAIEPFGEVNYGQSWYNIISPGNTSKMWDYMQDYWENVSGLHNILYVWGILSSGFVDYAAYPGNNRVDIISIHAFPLKVTLTPLAGYSSATDLPGGLLSLGKPMAIGAYSDNSNTGNANFYFPSLNNAIRTSMPKVIYLSWWWGYQPSTGKGQTAGVVNSSFATMLADPYSVMLGATPTATSTSTATRTPTPTPLSAIVHAEAVMVGESQARPWTYEHTSTAYNSTLSGRASRWRTAMVVVRAKTFRKITSHDRQPHYAGGRDSGSGRHRQGPQRGAD
jgi:Glycosyl hydrolase family 26